MVNVHEGDFDYITVRGRFAFIYQSLIVWEQVNGLSSTLHKVLVIHVLMLQVISFENILSTDQLTFQLLTLISLN